MHAVAALPASDSPFYKTQTVGCLVYFIICLTISSYQLDYSRKIADNERFTFSCKGLTDDYEKTLCRVAYNNGPNDLQGWLYLTTFLSPVLIMIIMSALMLRKNYTIQRNNCIVHIHQLYFLKVFLRFLFHLSVGLALFTKLWVFKTGQLILEGRYACVIGNSTVTCIDEKAKSKSKQNIVCCSLHGFLFVSSLFELVYYGYKWKRSGEDRNRQSNVSIHCGECGDCSYFIKTFNIFADCGSSSNNGTLSELQPLLPQRSSKEWIQKEKIDKLKETYKELHKTHKIHKVNENNRIVLKEVDISDFAVNLKIGRCSASNSDFRDETKRYLDNLKAAAGDAIDKSNLIDEKCRVTFIRGIAGMGKSVLAKQLTYGWASGDIYQNFKICVMFECRDLNYFKDHEGAMLEKHEILGEFINSKVDYDLGDGEGVLVIVDGLDELFDITEKDSIIGQLLSRKLYPMSKVILTGRPHIEDKVTGHDNMGCLSEVEINGLSEDQIAEYVDKFSPNEDHKERINKARSSSKGFLPIMYVPQFLNTLCCVAILSKGEAVLNSTELYCWTVYLLLKQHADKDGSSKKAPEVFREFSQTISTLSEVCHNLLTKNKIIFEGKIESRLGNIGKDKEFVESLFVDVSDNITDKYQFKHISLMEFLSALYICKKDMKTLLEIVRDNLEKGFIEVVSFVCRLLSGFSYEGITKEMLKNVFGLEQEVNEKQLLYDVIELLNECGLDNDTKLSRSFEIITFFLNKNFNDKEFIKSIIRKYHSDSFVSDYVTTHNMCLICRHLESCGWKEDDIRMAFANVWFGQIYVWEIEHLEVVTVKERFRIGRFGIVLQGINTTVNAIRNKFKGGKDGYCGWVLIARCKLMDDEVNSMCWNDRQLQMLRILECQVKTEESFFNACDWGMSCKNFWLSTLDIKIEWWERMVEMMEERRRKGDLKTVGLFIEKCTTYVSHRLRKRIVQCGVELQIDGRDVECSSRRCILL